MPTRALDGKTPYEMVTGRKPNLAGIQEFGVATYVKDLKAGKLDLRARKGRLVGYDTESKGYRIYWEGERKVSIERNVIFNPKDILTPSVELPIDFLAEGETGSNVQNTPVNTSSNSTSNIDQNSEKISKIIKPSEAPKELDVPVKRGGTPANEPAQHVPGPSEPPVQPRERVRWWRNLNRILDAVFGQDSLPEPMRGCTMGLRPMWQLCMTKATP